MKYCINPTRNFDLMYNVTAVFTVGSAWDPPVKRIYNFDFYNRLWDVVRNLVLASTRLLRISIGLTFTRSYRATWKPNLLTHNLNVEKRVALFGQGKTVLTNLVDTNLDGRSWSSVDLINDEAIRPLVLLGNRLHLGRGLELVFER